MYVSPSYTHQRMTSRIVLFTYSSILPESSLRILKVYFFKLGSDHAEVNAGRRKFTPHSNGLAAHRHGLRLQPQRKVICVLLALMCWHSPICRSGDYGVTEGKLAWGQGLDSSIISTGTADSGPCVLYARKT